MRLKNTILILLLGVANSSATFILSLEETSCERDEVACIDDSMDIHCPMNMTRYQCQPNSGETIASLGCCVSWLPQNEFSVGKDLFECSPCCLLPGKSINSCNQNQEPAEIKSQFQQRHRRYAADPLFWDFEREKHVHRSQLCKGQRSYPWFRDSTTNRRVHWSEICNNYPKEHSAGSNYPQGGGSLGSSYPQRGSSQSSYLQGQSAGSSYPQRRLTGSSFPHGGSVRSSYPEGASVGSSYPQGASVGSSYPQGGSVGSSYTQTGSSQLSYQQGGSVGSNYPQRGSFGSNYPQGGSVGSKYPQRGNSQSSYPQRGSSQSNYPQGGSAQLSYPQGQHDTRGTNGFNSRYQSSQSREYQSRNTYSINGGRQSTGSNRGRGMNPNGWRNQRDEKLCSEDSDPEHCPMENTSHGCKVSPEKVPRVLNVGHCHRWNPANNREVRETFYNCTACCELEGSFSIIGCEELYKNAYQHIVLDNSDDQEVQIGITSTVVPIEGDSGLDQTSTKQILPNESDFDHEPTNSRPFVPNESGNGYEVEPDTPANNIQSQDQSSQHEVQGQNQRRSTVRNEYNTSPTHANNIQSQDQSSQHEVQGQNQQRSNSRNEYNVSPTMSRVNQPFGGQSNDEIVNRRSNSRSSSNYERKDPIPNLPEFGNQSDQPHNGNDSERNNNDQNTRKQSAVQNQFPNMQASSKSSQSQTNGFSGRQDRDEDPATGDACTRMIEKHVCTNCINKHHALKFARRNSLIDDYVYNLENLEVGKKIVKDESCMLEWARVRSYWYCGPNRCRLKGTSNYCIIQQSKKSPFFWPKQCSPY